MAVAGGDRLSDLPDDLLRRILRFAPLKEAASTTALSRRWREPLWLSSGGVNLETGEECHHHNRKPRFFTKRDAFLSAAAGALDAADVPVRRLTLRLESDLSEEDDVFGDQLVSRYTDLVHAVVSRRAARRVQELRIAAKDPYNGGLAYSLFEEPRVGFYKVALSSLPLKTLRLLELTNCKGLLYETEAAAPVLRRLSSLRLKSSVQQLSSLQRVIDAAPALAAVHLKSVHIDATDAPPLMTKGATTRHLRCPTAKVLVLDSCKWKLKNQGSKKTVNAMEIHAPRLRRFRYEWN
jgi:hypothetical protein